MGLPSPKEPDYWDDEIEYQIQGMQRMESTGKWTGWYNIYYKGENHVRASEVECKAAVARLQQGRLPKDCTRRVYRILAITRSYRVVARFK